MIKTFITGIVLGIAGVIAALHYVPVVDQYREQSIITVATNGANVESFHVNIPTDRIMLGDQGSKRRMPPGMDWPDEPLFNDSRVELFKLRNSRNAVIGVASRLAAKNDELGDVIEWVLHLPARGSIFVGLNPAPVDGRRTGNLRAGTREFEGLVGTASERWVAKREADDDAQAGRIELLTTFVSTQTEDDAVAEVAEDAEE